MTSHIISYGKARVPVYRHGSGPDLLAAEVDVEVFGDNFLPAYTEGDNSAVVATDSIKNFVLRETGAWAGSTLEGLLDHLGRRLLGTYDQMEGLRVSGRELRFDPVGASGVLFTRSHGDHGVAVLDFAREGGGVRLSGLRAAREGMELLKLTGSAFTHFVRDDYTTLPERVDRPLYIGLDVGWRYADPADAVEADRGRYVAPAAVGRACAEVFDRFVSESIQQLVNEMGGELLRRFAPLAEVSFTARNLTRDPAGEGVYTDPFPAYGTITLTLAR
jgi:urate oxidase / 2-oxo-4-hydroxy-4-carboxy-5-ureidoimidazoline decarboxylase